MPTTRSNHNKRGIQQSVIDFPKVNQFQNPGTTFTLAMAESADSFVKWGKDVRRRDEQLREFWPSESFLAGAVSSVCIRNSAYTWKLEGPEKTMAAVDYMLNNAISVGGTGWMTFINALSQDLYTTDNGGFVEIIRKDEKSPVLGIAHLDSARCIRTSDPLFPVLYRDRNEKIHKMPWYNVIAYADMPSPIQTMHGVGVSAVTRVLRSAQILREIAQYKHEKVSGQFYRAIHFVGGVAKSEIDDVEKRGLEQAQNKGMVRYIMPLIIASLDPEKPVSSETIELASLPDNFNIDEEMKWYISSLALGFGVDYQDFAPLPGGNLGAGSQSEILHRKSRGKAPAWFMDMIVNSFKWRGVVPRNIEFNFVEQDLAAEGDEAKLRKSRAEERAIRIQSGEIDYATARILAERAGDMEGITISSIKDPEIQETGGIGGSAGGRVQGTDNGNRDEK